MSETRGTHSEGVVRATIRERRSIFTFDGRVVPRNVLTSLLDAGIWAPNHKLTEPWRFTVVGPQTHHALALLNGEIKADKLGNCTAEHRTQAQRAGLEKLESKPTIVAVSYVKEGDAARQREDYAATCCAIQNIQLAAWEAGVGVQWSTGALTRDARSYDVLGIDSVAEEIVGFLYMGYASVVPRGRRTHVDEVTRSTQ